MYKVLEKGQSRKFGNFGQHEIDCNCKYPDCTRTIVHSLILRSLEKLRKTVKAPLIVTSFYRCQRHNADEGGVDDSLHKIGLAVDVARPAGVPMDEFLKACRSSGFTFCLGYQDRGFVHCQINPRSSTQVI